MGNFMYEMQELTSLRERLRNRIGRLRAVIKKLPLYDPVSDSPNVAPEPVSTSSRQRPTKVAIYNYGPVGTLNTGEVLGDIHSHVSAVTGVSAEAFREAVEKFADSIAQNRELSDQNRQLVLESVDIAAEEANRPPERRRLTAVRGMLIAIPGAIALSGGAVGAWDRYGPSIRAFFGLP